VCVFSAISDFLIAHSKQQRICPTFCFRLGEKCITKAWDVKNRFRWQCFGQNTDFCVVSRITWMGWGGSVRNCEHSGHPYTGRIKENVENVSKVINKDRRSTIVEIAWWLGISYGISQRILEHAMDFRDVCVSFLNSEENHFNFWTLKHDFGLQHSLLSCFGNLWFVFVSETDIVATTSAFPGCSSNLGKIAPWLY
jgi:hypothetical protein